MSDAQLTIQKTFPREISHCEGVHICLFFDWTGVQGKGLNGIHLIFDLKKKKTEKGIVKIILQIVCITYNGY